MAKKKSKTRGNKRQAKKSARRTSGRATTQVRGRNNAQSNKPTTQANSRTNTQANKSNTQASGHSTLPKKKDFPKKFPFWARLKIGKNRTTLVIDEDKAYNKNKKEYEDGFVHREATHSKNSNYLKISPNPDKNDPKDMYLKRPEKKPKQLFKPHEKDLDMPNILSEMYEKNNKKE